MNVFFSIIFVLLVYMTVIFALALWLKDNSIVDVAYGVAFVLTVWVAFLAYGEGHPRQWLMVSLITIWGLRLACHILLRKQG
jgi:steroid 5-alpha reductase family enzyme